MCVLPQHIYLRAHTRVHREHLRKAGGALGGLRGGGYKWGEVVSENQTNKSLEWTGDTRLGGPTHVHAVETRFARTK